MKREPGAARQLEFRGAINERQIFLRHSVSPPAEIRMTAVEIDCGESELQIVQVPSHGQVRDPARNPRALGRYDAAVGEDVFAERGMHGIARGSGGRINRRIDVEINSEIVGQGYQRSREFGGGL